MVPMRSKEIYQTDDGRYVEVFTKVADIKEVPKEKQDNEQEGEEEQEYSQAEKIFVGVAHVPVGPTVKEIKFEITNATTIEEAFEMYHEIAIGAANEFLKMVQESMEKQRSQPQIVTADSTDLQQLNQIQKENKNSPQIVL